MSKSRLDVSTGGVSQIVALSQEAINDALYYLFDQHEELRTINVTSKLAGELNAQMDAAQVHLPVTDSGKFYTVIFYCVFKSGSLRLAEGDFRPALEAFSPTSELEPELADGEGNLGEPIDVSGWKFAFEVDFHKLDVPTGDEHDKVVKKLNQPGDYSVKRLFIDFSTNKISSWRKELCDYKGYKWQSQEDEIKLAFILANWGNVQKGVMKDPKLSTIGYYLETQKPETVNHLAPTFPPTALKHQIYKYIAPGDKEAKEGLKDGKYNALIYVEMTQNKPFPSDTPIPYLGNFVEPPKMKATACIGRQVFWDSYLLRDPSDLPNLFQEFNRCTYAWHNSLRAKSDSKEFGIEWKFGFGDDSAPSKLSPDSFRFDRTSATTWTWTHSTSNEDGHDSTEWPVHMSIDGYGKGSTTNTITVKPGSNSFTVSGSTELHLTGSWEFFLSKGSINQNVVVTWLTEVKMDSVHDGGLELTMHPSDPGDVFKVTNKATVYSGASGNDDKRPDLPDMPPAWQDAVKNIKFDNMTTALASALKNTSKFVLSGGDTLFYKNPIFNNNGDLLVEAEFKNE